MLKTRSVMRDNNEVSTIVDALLSARRQFRFRVIDVIINILRFFMLWKSLKLPYSQFLSKEFVAVCGIVTSSFSLFSMFVGEEVIKIEEKTQPSEDNKEA